MCVWIGEWICEDLREWMWEDVRRKCGCLDWDMLE